MQEVQKEPGVLAHRAGNVEQRHDRRRLGAGAEILEIDDRAPGLEASAQGAADIDDVAVTVGSEPPRLHLVESEDELLDRILGGDDLGGGHLREVFALQELAVGYREPGIDLALRRLWLALPPAPDTALARG